MKKIGLKIFVILIFTMVLSMVFLAINPNMTKAGTIISTDEKWKYEKLEDNTIKITGINKMDKSQQLLEIPEQIDGYTVSSLDLANIQDNYENKYNISDKLASEYSIKIPKTVNNITSDISTSRYYRTVIMYEVSEENNTYKTVDGVIFSKDGKELVAYPGGKKVLTYTIPEGTETIKDNAFNLVNNTKTLIFPNTIKKLEHSALNRYTKLKTLDIKKYNGELNFSNTSSLEKIIVDSENTAYSVIDGILFNKEQNLIIKYPPMKEGEIYTIQKGVDISNNCFSYNNYLKSIIIESNITKIPDYAFQYCDELTSIVLPNGLEIIGTYAFYNCDKLKTINIPNTVTEIGEGAFKDCDELTSIVLPNGLKKINQMTFMFCEKLETINIPNTVTDIGYAAFISSGLKTITFPEKIKSISFQSFQSCRQLESVYIPNGVEEIEDYAFDNCIALKSINIPVSVEKIGSNAFKYCSNFTVKCEKNSLAYEWAMENKESKNLTLEVTDTIAPVCKNITVKTSDGKEVYSDTKINSNLYYTITFSEDVVGFTKDDIEVTNGTKGTFTGSGKEYILEVIPVVDGTQTIKIPKGVYADEAGNVNNEVKNSYECNIDITKPTCEIGIYKSDSTIKTENGIVTKLNNVEYVFNFSENVKGFTKDDIEVTNGTKGGFSGSGRKYTLIVTNDTEGEQVVKIPQGACTDSAGNKIAETVKKVVIDRTGPVGSVSYSTTEKTGSAVVAKISANEEMQEIEGWTLSADKKELTKSYEDNTEETVTIKDLLGNESSVTIKISNIDKTLPKGEVTYSTAEYTNQDVTVTINVDKQVQAINGWTLSEDKKVLTKKYTQNTEETVTITDLAGNRSIVTVKIANIDKEAPVIGEITLSTKEITNQDVEITVNATDAISGIEGYSWDEKQTWNTVNKVNAKTNGIYTIYVKDKAGNISSKTIEVTNINKEPEKLAISATKYKVDGNYIINIKPETKVSEVKNDVKSNREYEIQKTDGTKLTENDIVATGYKVKFATGETYEIVVNGDVSGDGKITITDIAKIKKHIIILEKLTGAYLKAGDVNENDTVTVTDLAKIKKVIIGLVNL